MEDDQQILDALYLGTTDAKAFEEAIVLLAAQFGCVSSALVALDNQVPEANLILSTGVIDEAASRLYATHFSTVDPAPAAFAALPVGKACTTDRIMTREQFESEFVNDFYFPLGLRETLGGHLMSNGGRFALIGLHRGPDREPFSDAEIAKLERVMPHVTRALQLRRAFIQAHAQSAGFQALLDQNAAGIALMDGMDMALFVNSTLRAIAARHDGISIDRDGRLEAANSDAQRRLQSMIADVRAGGAGGLVSIPRPDVRSSYSALVATAPVSLAQQAWDRSGRATAIVLVHDPDSRPKNAVELLRHGMGLTHGAARLVAALAADDDLKSFAERDGVTIHTARFHLHTALARTGKRGQPELVRAAVRLLRDLSL